MIIYFFDFVIFYFLSWLCICYYFSQIVLFFINNLWLNLLLINPPTLDNFHICAPSMSEVFFSFGGLFLLHIIWPWSPLTPIYSTCPWNYFSKPLGFSNNLPNTLLIFLQTHFALFSLQILTRYALSNHPFVVYYGYILANGLIYLQLLVMFVIMGQVEALLRSCHLPS